MEKCIPIRLLYKFWSIYMINVNQKTENKNVRKEEIRYLSLKQIEIFVTKRCGFSVADKKKIGLCPSFPKVSGFF